MIEVIILIVSMVAFAQFWVYYWRATMSGVAAQAISERIRVAAGITHESISAEDFRSILILKHLSPNLRGTNGSLIATRSYYRELEKVERSLHAMSSCAHAQTTQST